MGCIASLLLQYAVCCAEVTDPLSLEVGYLTVFLAIMTVYVAPTKHLNARQIGEPLLSRRRPSFGVLGCC